MISVNHIGFSYSTKKILQDISFDIQGSHCVAVLGNNGAGKSTLIKCLNRIHAAKEGTVVVEGQNVFDLGRNELAKRIAYVAQKNETSRITVYDTVLLGRKPYIKWDVSKEDTRIVDEILEQMGLQDFTLRYLDELSGGELQKVMLARALAQQPKFLHLHEPTSNLDPRNQYEMLRLVSRIAKERQIAVAIVIHDLNLALRYCDRFLFVKDSKVYSYGGIETMTPESIEDVYQIHVHIHDHNGIQVVIPFPDEKLEHLEKARMSVLESSSCISKEA